MKNNKKNIATKAPRHQDTPSFFYNKTLCAPSCLGAFVAFSKIAQIGHKATQNLSACVCMAAVSFKRFKGVFCDEFLKSGYNGDSLKMAFKELKDGLKGGLMGLEVSLKKRGVFIQKWLKDQMPKTQLCHQGTKTPRYTKVLFNIGG